MLWAGLQDGVPCVALTCRWEVLRPPESWVHRGIVQTCVDRACGQCRDCLLLLEELLPLAWSWLDDAGLRWAARPWASVWFFTCALHH